MKRCLLLAAIFIQFAGCSARESSFTQLDGESIRFSELQGKVVLINYWAIWCKPCREEIPELNRLQKKYPTNVKVIGVNYDGVGGETLRNQAESLDIQFSVILEDPRGLYNAKPSGVIPETLVIDTRGELTQILLGPQTESSLETLLSELQTKSL